MDSQHRPVRVNHIGGHPLDGVLDALDLLGLRWHGRGRQFEAQCPAHHDRSPSLGVALSDTGAVLVHCQGGCETGDVVAALGLGWRDLFPDDDHDWRVGWTPRPPRPTVGSVEWLMPLMDQFAHRADQRARYERGGPSRPQPPEPWPPPLADRDVGDDADAAYAEQARRAARDYFEPMRARLWDRAVCDE